MSTIPRIVLVAFSALPADGSRETAHTLACAAGVGRSRSTPARSSWRPRTRLLATRVWARRSSVDHRIASDRRCHLHDRSALDHPAVQFISRRTQPAPLRCALTSSRNQMVYQPVCAEDLTGSSGRLALEGSRHPRAWPPRASPSEFRSAPTPERAKRRTPSSPTGRVRAARGLFERGEAHRRASPRERAVSSPPDGSTDHLLCGEVLACTSVY